MSDRDLDRLLAGKAPQGDEGLQELAAFLREVKAAHLEAPGAQTHARQLAAIADAAQLLNDKGEPVAWPASKATGPGRQASGLPKWRHKLVLTQLFSTLWAKVAVASIAATLASGGLAFAGALPDPVQGAVADAADQVGVSVEDPDVDEPGDVDATDDGDANKPDDDANQRDDDANQRDDGNANQRDEGDNGNGTQGNVANGNVGRAAPPNDVRAFQQDDDANEPADDHANEPDDDANEPDDDADEGDDDENKAQGQDDDEDADEPGDVDNDDEEDSEGEGGSEDD